MLNIPLPRVDLGCWPTPLHEMPNLTEALGGPRLFIKRDDLTGLALGGNKCRKLEYVLADAQEKGVDTLITSGSSQSNFALQMAVAARMLGMEPHLLLVKGVHAEIQGNLLLHDIIDSSVTILEVSDPIEMFTTMPKNMEELADEMRQQGRHPMVIPAGAEYPLGTLGWVRAAQEIHQQLKEMNVHMKAVVLANGGGGTQAGLILGLRQLNMNLPVVGISVLNERTEAMGEVIRHHNETSVFLGLDSTITVDEVELYDDYIGEGYGIPTPKGIEAIRLVARTEGIFLDPVYSGKAMSGLIDLIHQGIFTEDDTVLFIHTGGVAAGFAYHEEMKISRRSA